MNYDIEDVVGLNEANTEMVDSTYNSAPTCHFKTMRYEYGDYDSYESDKWICDACGHTKEVNV